jgi:hypothetical protein
VLLFGLIEVQRPSQSLQNRIRDPRKVPALEPGVVVEAHPGQRRDLFTPQPRYPPLFAVCWQPGLLRGDPRPAADQKVVYGLTVHTSTLRAGQQPEEGIASTRVSAPCHLANPLTHASHPETGDVCSGGRGKPLLPSCDEKRGRAHKAAPWRVLAVPVSSRVWVLASKPRSQQTKDVRKRGMSCPMSQL